MAKAINTNFFDSWTEESAYTLGFIYADGYLTKDRNSAVFGLSNNDRDIIEQIRIAMGSEHKIHCDTRGNPNYKLMICNKHMTDRLQKLGLSFNKSKNKTFPDIPDEYVMHFIRGYFDGNGSFVQEHSKKQKLRRIISEFSTGSEEFAKGIISNLHRLGLRESTLFHRTNHGWGEYYQFKYYTIDTRKLYHLMYDNATIYMKRKKNIFVDNN